MMRLLSRLAGGVDAQLAAMQASIPTAAQAMPPGVGVGGAKGSQTTAYALADHTHASSVQRQRVTVALAGSSGRFAWTFPASYPVGSIPVVGATVETPDAASYTYDAKVLAGSVTNTGCVIVVNKLNQAVTLPGLATALLGFVVNVFGPATGTVTVHVSAAKDTTA